MKTFFKNNLYLFIILFFLFLLFQNNIVFKNCILNGCLLFFEQVFPSLFPMFILNDLLLNYNFFFWIEKTIHKIFKKLFGFSKCASYIFVMSMTSGTPTNAYLTANLVKENKVSKKDAGIILAYSCFLNPLFLFTMLNFIFHHQGTAIKLICIHYGLNFFIAFLFRKYPYEQKEFKTSTPKNFTSTLSKSLKRSTDTLFLILGTIIFYFILCEGINLFINSPLLNCLMNGILEATGGLVKISSLQINNHLKEILVSLFISFGGLSIHSQIQNIISEVGISAHSFFLGRCLHAFLSTLICIIIP